MTEAELELPTHLSEIAQIEYMGSLAVAEMIAEQLALNPADEELKYHLSICNSLIECLEQIDQPAYEYHPERPHKLSPNPFRYLFHRYAPEYEDRMSEVFSQSIRRLRIT